MNKGRKIATFQEGDFVLVSKKRFPQWTISKFGSQWFGPYKITNVKSNCVEIHASQILGGNVEVAYAFLKRYPLEIYDDEQIDDTEMEEIAKEDEENAPQVEPKMEFSEKEHQERGYFLVEKILKHKYKQGYFFLVKWENYALEDSTWEPIKAFVFEDGRINEIFKRYCEDHKLEQAWKIALRLTQ